MRNLKKILALVLALVMSMSLVVTANAFEDTADVDFSEAIDVLSGLEVFQGRTETEFAPKASITRAEVAAIIYRIVTADVENKQVGIYADYNKFDDVNSNNWFAGYVNYCANATYIGGYGNGKFGPNDPVTGYQALAMILRAVGYGKNGEFSGTGWEVRTASVAKSLGITDNILDGTLGMPATREMVAEILFRAILVPTVTWNMAFGYQETNTTLGYEAFKLECIEGVVVANEFANLYGNNVRPEGKTELETEDGIRTLAIGSELTDIGESRYAYISSKGVHVLADTGYNATFETGVATSAAKFAKASGLSLSGAEYYVNFGEGDYYTSDYRIKYVVSIADAADIDGVKAALKELKLVIDAADFDRVGTTNEWVYEKAFKVDERISSTHMGNIERLFSIADKEETEAGEYVTGEVYVGTKSTEDISDKLSFKKFKADYINDKAYDDTAADIVNGQWLKLVDNNGDGVAEYAFKTESNLDVVIDTYTKKDVTYFEYNNLDVIDEYDARYLDGYEPEVGDVVLYSVIDGQALIEKANSVETEINEVSFRNKTITTVDGETYGQSAIANHTGMDEIITDMDEETNYVIYFDHFGTVRAYRLAEGTKYALVTEMYWTRSQNGQYIKNADLIAEVKAGSEKIDEFEVLNEKNNDLLLSGDRDWADLGGIYSTIKNSQYIVLQPATYDMPTNVDANIFRPALTNVAKYVQTEDGVRLESAVVKNKGNDVINYVELDPEQDIAAKDRLYKVAGDNDQVDAVHGTEYYLVTKGGIRYFTDYTNVPAIKGDKIDAIYAVARNTNADKAADPYWVADVIVIEAYGWTSGFDSISLAYYNNKQNSGKVKNLETLNNKTEGSVQNVVDANEPWGNQWDDFGFYGLSDTEMDGETLMAGRITKLGLGDYNANKIYAGTVHEIRSIDRDGGYITVDLTGANGTRATGSENIVTVDVDGSDVFAIGTEKPVTGNDCDYETLRLSSNKNTQVQVGDEIIWVETNAGVSFIVDVAFTDDDWKAPNWLWAIYDEIIAEQNPATALVNMTVKGEKVTFNEEAKTGAVEITSAQAADTDTPDWTVSVAEGYAKVNGNRNSGITTIHNGDTYAVTVYNDDNQLVDTYTVTVTVKQDSNTNVKVLVKGVEAKFEEGNTSTGETVDDPFEMVVTVTYADDMTDAKVAVLTPDVSTSKAAFTNTGTVDYTAVANQTGAISTSEDGKYFDFTVTSEDGTVAYYRVNITVDYSTGSVTVDAASTKGPNVNVPTFEKGYNASTTFTAPTNDNLVFTLTAATGYEITSVQYRVGATGTPVNATCVDAAAGKYMVPAAALAAADDTVYILTTADVKQEATVKAASANTVWYGDGKTLLDTTGVAFSLNETVTVWVDKDKTVSVDSGAVLTPVVSSNTNFNAWTLDLSAVTAGATVTVTVA